MEIDGTDSLCSTKSFVNEVPSELTYFSKGLHGANEFPSVFSSSYALLMALLILHFLILIESKPRFCSKPCFKGRQGQTIWKPM